MAAIARRRSGTTGVTLKEKKKIVVIKNQAVVVTQNPTSSPQISDIIAFCLVSSCLLVVAPGCGDLLSTILLERPCPTDAPLRLLGGASACASIRFLHELHTAAVA